MGMRQEFMDFMKKQNVVAVALGLVTGFATLALINALVADLITPIYKPYIAFLDPKASVTIGLSQFMVGDFIQAFISFIVILFVVFMIGKRMGKSL